MLRVGLTGGLASGKTFVGKALEGMGCLLIQADLLGHQVLEPGGEAYDGAVREFGRDILDSEGAIDRRKLGQLAFQDPERLERLNRLVHPPVRARAARMAEVYFAAHPDGIAVTEAAILIETGSYRNFDRLIVVVCSEEQQIERAMHRDGITREEAQTRLGQQMPLQEKIRHGDYVIDTSGPKENTLEQTRAVYRSLRSLSS